jgi:pyrroline-5-carboxylate reductase
MRAAELAIIGGGNMGLALAAGLVDSGVVRAAELAVVEVAPARRSVLVDALPGVAISSEVPPCASAIVAVKPADVTSAVRAATTAGAARILSIAAGVTLATLRRAADPSSTTMIRAMPNTPALVRQGVSAIAGGPDAAPEDLEWAERVLGAVGLVVRVPESQLDAVTGLSGSGPAYVFLIAEALTEAGVLNGLARPVADRLVRQLLVGSAALLAASPDSPATLRANVTSPAGTTAAGLRVLEQRAVRAAFIDAVVSATERSRDLAEG